MGGAQSAQREDKKDSAAEESEKVDDAQTEQRYEDKPLKNNGQVSEISGKAAGTVAGVPSRCEDELAADAVVSADASDAEKPRREETPREALEMNEKESPNEADANEEVSLETIEMDAKHNDINESFRKFFSNINVKVTVKRGSAEKDDIAAHAPDDTAEEEPNRPEGAEDSANEDKSVNVDNNTPQETHDHDASYPPPTDIIPEDSREKTEEKTTETKEDVYSTPEPVGDEEHIQQNVTSDEELVVSPVKRFFTSGIFSGLRKKKRSTEDETTEKEVVGMLKVEAGETTEQPAEAEQEHDQGSNPGPEADTLQAEQKENGLKEEIPSSASALTTDPSAIIVNEPEILSSQEKDKVQASPLKRLLSGSSFKKTSKKPRERKSSEARLSDSGEHFSNQLPSSPDAADSQREEGPAGEEDGAWASFKKLMTPKKRMKRSSLTNEETQIPSLVQESKSSEGEQISDNSTEESKKRKDSSISWEAVLCGSARRRSRSRKTSDSEDEKPQDESDNRKQESPLESSNEADKSQASYTKQEGSPSEGDGGSTWKSFKKLVTPKRKTKDDDIQSDGEVTQDDSTFSIKKLLPGQKKRKPAEKQDYASSDEADKEVASDDEDSETPAVVPLSEFDMVDPVVHIQTHADIESHIPKEEEEPDRMTDPGLICDRLQKDQNKEDALESIKQTPSSPASKEEEPDEISELISKHQQLSDIPEETMVTPSSVYEQAARDDTIAEDLIEITSEAITAPEPVDITQADETEMISAVSQLSGSSNTSGNTTPVPAEYDVKDTEVLLQQVAENICISPKADPLCSDDISSERLVASVSCQILETFVKQQPTILEMHRRSDATAFKTGLNVKEFQAVHRLAAATQTESIREVSEAVSTEIVSEVPTEVGAAEHSVDEIHNIRVTHTDESVQELESTKSHGHEAASTEMLSESEGTVECSLVEACQTETETSQSDLQDDETKDGDVDQEVKTMTETREEILQSNTEQVQAGKQDQSCSVVQELQAVKPDTFASDKDTGAISAGETFTDETKDKLQVEAVLDSQISGIEKHEKERSISEDIPAPETMTDKPKGQPELLPEVHLDLEKEDGLQPDSAKMELGQVPEVLAALDSEVANIHEISESVSKADTSQCQEEAEHLTEVNLESDMKDLEEDVAKTELSQVPEVLAVQEAAMDSQIGSIQKPEWKVDAAKTEQASKTPAEQASADVSHIGSIQMLEQELLLSEDTRPEKAVTDEAKDQLQPLSKFNVELEKKDELQADSANTEHEQDPEALAVQEAAQDPQSGNLQTPGRKTLLSRTVSDEPKDLAEPLIQVNVEPEEKDEAKADAITEDILEQQATAPVSLIGTIKVSEKEVTVSEDTRQDEAVTTKARDETEDVTEVHVEPEKEDELNKQDPEVLDVTTDDVPPEEDVADEAKQGTELCAEVYLKPEKEDEQQAEDTKPEKAVTDESKQDTESVTEPEKEGEQQAEDSKSLQAVTDEPKQDTESVTELKNKELEAHGAKTEVSEVCRSEQETAKTEHDHVPEVLSALDLQIRSIPVSTEEVPLSGDSKPEEPKVQPEPLTEVHVQPQQEDERADDAETDQVQELELLGDVQAAELDSQTDVIQIPEKEVSLSLEMKPEKAVTEPSEEREPVNEPHADSAKTEQGQDSEIEEQATALVSEMGSNYLPKKEEILPEDSNIQEAVTGELKEETEPVNTQLHEDAAKTEREQDPVLNAEEAALDSDMAKIQTPGTERGLSEDTQPTETVTEERAERLAVSTAATESKIKEPLVDAPTMDEPQGEPEATPRGEADGPKQPEPVDSSKPEQVQDPEVLEAAVAKLVSDEIHTVSLTKEVIPEDTETASGEPTQVPEGNGEPEEELPGPDPKPEHVQEPEALPCDSGTCKSGCMTGSVNAQQSDIEDIYRPGTNFVSVSATETERQAAAEPNQDSETNVPQHVQVEQEDGIPEVVGNLQSASAVHVSSVTEERNRARVLEKKVVSEKGTAPRSTNATVTYEPKYEVHLSDVQGQDGEEKEAELPGPERKTCAAEHAVVKQVTTCNLKEVTAVTAGVQTETPSNGHEPFMGAAVTESELKENAVSEKAKRHVTETATESSVVVTMHVPAAEREDRHTIQVQVIGVHVNTAESNVDSVVEVGAEEAREVIDVCHEAIRAVDKLSATEETEEEFNNEEFKTIDASVLQHVQEKLAESLAAPTATRDEAASPEQQDATQMSPMADKRSADVDDAFSHGQDETPAISDEAAAEQPEDVTQTPRSPGSFHVAFQDHSVDVGGNEAASKRLEAGVTAEEVRVSSEGFQMKITEGVQTAESFGSPTVTVSNTGLEVPQKTGLTSPGGHLDSPSSLSLEFKLNIQFGHAAAPESSSLATEKTEAPLSPAPVKQTTVSEVGVQADEPPKAVNATLESHKESEVLSEVTAQATEITEPELVQLDTTDRAVITKQPVLLDFGIQSVEAVQPVEHVKSTEGLSPSVPGAEKIKAVMQAETFLSQPVLYEACYEEIKVEEPVKQLEEENDQELWVDAEEDIQTQEASDTSLLKLEEPVAPQAEGDKEEEEKAELDHEFEMAPETAPKLKTKDEESLREICETENELEEFDVAPEHPETSPTSKME